MWQVEEGWWSGSFNGKSGLFPSNFVKELDAAGEEAETNNTAADKTGNGNGLGATSGDWNNTPPSVNEES